MQKKIIFNEFKIKPEPENYDSIWGNFMEFNVEVKKYVLIEDMVQLKDLLHKYIEEYNESNKNKIDILLFNEAIHNLARLNRILARPYGHAVLIGLGGDGRRTLSRLASFMQDYTLEELPGEKEVIAVDWYDFLRNVQRNSGVEEIQQSLILTDSQLQNDKFFEDINN